jgi:creatinine amidohydrolase
MQNGELQVCIVPIAAIEQHLEHLAMEHDWRSACHVASEVALRLQPNVLVAEAIMAGVSEHHMRHPGTITLRVGTFLSVLEDVIGSLVRAGFQNILVLNGHGGNIVPCRSNWDQLLRRFQINLQFLPYWDVLTQDDARELLRGGHEVPKNLPGHAQEFETAFGLAAFAENVRTEIWQDQPDQAPSLATAEAGHKFIERIVERVAVYVQEMIDGQRVAEVPPFHP